MKMTKEKQNLPPQGELLVYQTDDGQVKLDVRLENESLWLTQARMAELFQTTQQNISQHILNVYDEGELVVEATHKKYLSVRQEGARQVKRDLEYYNLDMIISVGYRVKSVIATRFRIWATERLREYIVKGFTMDDDRLKELDDFLKLSERNILTHAGSITHDEAMLKVHAEYEKFHAAQLKLPTRAETDFLKIEAELKQLESKK